MFKHVSEFVVRVANLAEAEGRRLRAIVTRLGLGFALLLAAALLIVMGIGCVAYAIFKGLVSVNVGEAPAALLTGLATLGIAGGLGLWGVRSMKDDPPEKMK